MASPTFVTPIDTLQVALAFAQAGLLFFLFLAAFSLRRTLGFGPLFLFVGAIEGLKYFLTAGFQLTIGETEIAVSSAIYFPATLALILLVYVREDAADTRQLLWSLAVAGVSVGLLMALVSMQQKLDAMQASALAANLWRLLVGTALLLIDAVLAIVLYERLTRWRWPFLLRFWLPLFIVATLDTLFYLGLTGGLSGFASLATAYTSLGKGLTLGLYTLMAWVYLRFVERQALAIDSSLAGELDVRALLTFGERFERLERQVITDSLTGIFNRRHLDVWLPDHVRLAHQRDEVLTLLLVDLDHFKRINDQYGHQVGDEALRHFTRVAQSVLRRGDEFFRYGGEEFVIVLPRRTLAEGVEIAQAIQQELVRVSLMSHQDAIRISVTIGATQLRANGESAADLLRRADERLYAGKRGGRGMIVADDATPRAG